MKKICVLGLGYIGLPTSLLFAINGNKVIGVDINKQIVDIINKRKAPFKEDGLVELFKKAFDSNNFYANTMVENADVFLIAVQTPLDNEAKLADLKYVKSAANMIYPFLSKGNLVIIESTIPPGTSEKIIVPILEKSGLKNDLDFDLVHCPERAIPGNTIYEMINNDRIIGGSNIKSVEFAKELYSCYVNGNFHMTDIRTAEICKLMENTYRDINIALANEFAQIADECGIDVWKAIELANKHPRVNILKPGPGVGGHCIAIDPWFLRENSSKSRIISLSREINDSMPNYVISKVKEILKGMHQPMITVFGIAYKGNVGDCRETPALKILKLAEKEGFRIKIYDPHVTKFEYPLSDLNIAVKDTDCIVVVTDHSDFKNIDPVKIESLVRNKNVLDTRNILDQSQWEASGFNFNLIGRSKTVF